MLVIGVMGSINNWIIAPTRGLLIAALDGNLPNHCQRLNKYGAPSVLLIYQALIVSVVSMAFLLMPSVNGSYWLLTVLAAQLYMFMYLLMFAAAIYLRYKRRDSLSPGFRIPGGKMAGIIGVGGLGILSSLGTVIIGFIPPANIKVGGFFHYEMLLTLGLILMSLPPFIFYRFKKPSTT